MNIKNLSQQNLEKYFIILNHIRDVAELDGRYNFLCIGKEGYLGENIEGISSNEFQQIYWNFVHNDIIFNPIHADNGNLFIDINEKLFYKLYLEIENALNVQKQDYIDNIFRLNFDKDAGTLFFNNYQIKISKRKNKTYAHEVLEYIFKNGIENQYFYSEILIDVLGSETDSNDKNKWKVIYRACEDIQNKISKATNYKITDFLIFNSGIKGSVKINMKYLKK
jgi:hypothetical protein